MWITIDSWTSRATQSYCGIILHFLSPDFDPMSFVLTTVATNDHDAQSLSTEIKATLRVWELQNTKGMVGDNTRTVPKTAQLVAEDVDFEEFEFWGCAAHLINLVVKHSLEMHKPATLIAKCRAIVTYLHKSSQALEKLHDYEEKAGIKKLGVVQDVEGRWSSTYLMMERLQKILEPINKTLRNQIRRDLLLTDQEWGIVGELVTCLEEFANATEVISGSCGSIYSSCIPIIAHLKNSTAITPSGSSETFKEVNLKLNELIDHYFFGKDFLNIFAPESLVYCLLDPRFKHLNFVPNEKASAAKQVLVDLHSKVFEKPMTNNNEENSADEKKRNKLLGLYGFQQEPKGTARTTLNSYFEEPALDPLSNPLKWWNTKQHTYPTLAKLARQYLARPSTSVPCERLWSQTGNIVNDLRCSLDSDSVAMLNFLQLQLARTKTTRKAI